MLHHTSYIQKIVNDGPDAEYYGTDGYVRYMDVIYPRVHIQNIHDKSNTFTVEGINAVLRHYIPILARRSRCFPHSLETLRVVVEVFAEAYNRFGLAQFKYRQLHQRKEIPFGLVDFL